MAHACWSCPPPLSAPIQGLSSATSLAFQPNRSIQFLKLTLKFPHPRNMIVTNRPPLTISCLSSSSSFSSSSSSSSSTESVETAATAAGNPMRVLRKRTRYRKQYPGEREGITEEMRFVAMRLRYVNGNKIESHEKQQGDEDDEGTGGASAHAWQPTMEGFLKYLVDSKLVFDAVERIVDESNDVSYAYFRKTGLERSRGLSEDLGWFSQQGNVIPPPSNPGITYVKYLEELAEKSAPLFLCHFYNIYFSHIAGGQVIAKRVSESLLEGRELQFYRWEGDAEGMLKVVREKLNMLGEHWSRDEKNKCLREATKSFRYLGQIVRLIIL